jgi:hypothetical protein
MILVPIVLCFAAADEPALTADEIMARVAENQNRAQEMRSAFVYHQNVLVRLSRSNGKLAREEYSEYTVTPTPQGTRKERTLFRGKYVDHGKTVNFDTPGYEHKKIDADASLGNSMAESFTNDKKSRDGIEHDFFPLTSKQQRKYNFKLEGTEDYRGTSVYRITFTPKKKPFILDADEPGDDEDIWTGEVLVHRDEFQPVLITTTLATQVPAWAKTVFGTDVREAGFKVTYKKFDEGLWFPVTYGGEFKLKVLFLYSRRIGISMQNSGFERAQVDSTVTFADVR